MMLLFAEESETSVVQVLNPVVQDRRKLVPGAYVEKVNRWNDVFRVRFEFERWRDCRNGDLLEN